MDGETYMVTEWGYGYWESPMTNWGVAIEATSKEKLNSVLWLTRQLNECSLCLGSYAFLWGYKQEQTPTWYGLFTKWRDYTKYRCFK